MIKTYLKQAWQVMKLNPFFSFISVLSTAVTIAFSYCGNSGCIILLQSIT